MFYKPKTGWCADIIPFYKDGTYYLYYLHDYRDIENYGEGTPWYLVTTTDFVNFKEYGEVVPRGTAEEQDLYVFTGCVVEDIANVSDHKYHIFYTGHNPHFIAQGKPQEAVMHCVSDDLIHWKKCEGELYFAPKGYEPHDWRDPFVWFDHHAGEYRMLTAARFSDGPSRYRGVIAMSASKDLVHWEIREPMYQAREYFIYECPDYFEWNGYYYLIFSEFTGENRTHYRVSKNPYGPWRVMEDEFFDTRCFYAAKTAGTHQERYIFGWNPSRADEKDSGNWMWGSHMVVHKLHQRKDGSLYVSAPPAVENYYSNKHEARVKAVFGNVSSGNSIQLDSSISTAMAIFEDMQYEFKIEAEFKFDDQVTSFGFLFHSSEDMEQSYYLRYEPKNGRLVFDKWPKPVLGVPFMPESERKFQHAGNEVKIVAYVVDTQILAYISDEKGIVALSSRMYDLKGGYVGAFAQNGLVSLSNCYIYTK